tara:strand:- start:51 stop:341 length:291 start_codon:yes stop_codon:yes gene_type:complete
MIITIEGNIGGNKSTVADKIASGGVAFYTSSREIEHVFWTNHMKATTQYIIIDATEYYGSIKKMFRNKKLKISRKNGQELSIMMPTIILIKKANSI